MPTRVGRHLRRRCSPRLMAAAFRAVASRRQTVATGTAPRRRRCASRFPAAPVGRPCDPFPLRFEDQPAAAEGHRRCIELLRLRKISDRARADGARACCLNNAPLFQFGFLDQGFWPDGLHTPPTDEAMRTDIASTRGFGNEPRAQTQSRSEPERWYYWADKLGLLVWQDMPSRRNTTPGGPPRTSPDEWRRCIDARLQPPVDRHVGPVNEGWGQPTPSGRAKMADWTAR